VMDNLRRYARDAYALTVLLHSRKHVTVIAGRRDPRDEPLTPSRLLFATEPEEIARRIERFYSEVEKPLAIAGPFTATRRTSGFVIPRPVPQPAPLADLRVTAFADYLASPYRFYLRHVLKLKEERVDVDELDAPAFGDLIHEVLSQFGHHESRFATDEKEIRRYLEDRLEHEAHRRFGDDPYVPIRVQIEQARLRLRAFAGWQAEWTRQGWSIAYSEISQDRSPARFELDDGRSISLRGRIDRIDRHEREDRWMIFDYKTGESANPPDKAHRRGGEWFDLQLPLYRHLARPLGVEGRVDLGYITLPRDVSDVRELVADWSETDLESADAVAREIARKILDEAFWAELDVPPDRLTEYGSVCQDGVFDREAIV
jgi:ATP-dependent helicase/nuclease subunit B